MKKIFLLSVSVFLFSNHFVFTQSQGNAPATWKSNADLNYNSSNTGYLPGQASQSQTMQGIAGQQQPGGKGAAATAVLGPDIDALGSA